MSYLAASAAAGTAAATAATPPAAAAAGGSALGDVGLTVQSVVIDFMGFRDRMDACCRSLQTLASAARTVQSSRSFV